ncbi:RNA polymerase sigma-70 factor [Fulvivirga sp.]|uniref:RNA polymerase sigma-70 factor n=1 Tax=Fulvivirga sp. TaxID=1931237 RepID=UPI0032EC34EC
MIDLQEIALKIRSGDKHAFEVLFRHSYGTMCGYAKKYIADTDEAEGIVQDVFVNFWERRDAIEISDSIEAYLYRSVRNSCLNQLKHSQVKAKYAMEQVLAYKNTDAVTTDTLEDLELQQKIDACIDSLPIERRKIFKLSREDGLKYKEIANELNISIKTVENQMGKALKHLRTHLAEYLPFLVWIILVLKNNFMIWIGVIVFGVVNI